MTNQNKETIFTNLVRRTLARMPSEFEDWVMKKIIIVFPKEGKLALTIHRNDSKHYEGVIFLYEELLTKDEPYQEYCLLHEIAHVKLKHRTQDDAEKERKQEAEANHLALKWLTEAQFKEATKKLNESEGRKN